MGRTWNSVSAPRLVILTDFRAYPRAFERLSTVCEAAQPGEVAVVLRDREEPTKMRYQRGLRLRKLTTRTEQKLWVSDRLDLALALGADGLHLPSGGWSPCAVKPFFGWLSRAVHDWSAQSCDELAALSALLISPVWAERKGRASLGLGGFQEKMEQIRANAPHLCFYALGGVSAQNVEACLAAGAVGGAVVSAALSPQARPEELLGALGIRRGVDPLR